MSGRLGCVQLFAITIYTLQTLFCICTSVSIGWIPESKIAVSKTSVQTWLFIFPFNHLFIHAEFHTEIKSNVQKHCIAILQSNFISAESSNKKSRFICFFNFIFLVINFYCVFQKYLSVTDWKFRKLTLPRIKFERHWYRQLQLEGKHTLSQRTEWKDACYIPANCFLSQWRSVIVSICHVTVYWMYRDLFLPL